MTKNWNVGILGLGHWYSAYFLARAIPEYPKASLKAVAWPNADQLGLFANTFGLDAYQDYDAIIERDDIDIVHIAPPVADIPDLTIRAARAGKHIILGKPMAMTVEQADRMVQAVEEAGVVCVPFQAIGRLGLQSLKDRIARGLIGDIAVIHTVSRWSIAEDWFRSGKPGWFADPAFVPGGALIDEGIYGLETLRWLVGSDVVEVDARIANLVHKDIDVEDWGMATYTFANGVIATQEASWTINAPRKTGPSPKQNAVVRWEIIGATGEIIDQSVGMPGRAVLAEGADNWIFERQAGEPFGPAVPNPLDHLIHCIENGAQPITTIQEARDTFAVAMAAYRSAKERRAVRL